MRSGKKINITLDDSSKVRILLDGRNQDFTISGVSEDGVLEIYQNESLFTVEFVEATRKLRKNPTKNHVLGENKQGLPVWADKTSPDFSFRNFSPYYEEEDE